MPEDARHSKSLGVIPRCRYIEQRAVQEQGIAEQRAGGGPKAIVRNQLGLHFLGGGFNAPHDLRGRELDYASAAMHQTAQPVLMVPHVNVSRFKLVKERQASQ